MSFVVVVEGLKNVQDVSLSQERIRFAAVQAVNKVARDTRAKAARRIREQINIPATYLQPGQKRLYVSKRAQRSDPTAIITARSRPTSLARYVQSGGRGREGVQLEVQPNRTTYMRRAFLIKLKAGSGPVDTKYNMGLAIRLREGETVENKRNVRRLEKGLYLLYGPSIDQVFLDNAQKGVADDLAPGILDDLEAEAIRLLGLD